MSKDLLAVQPLTFPFQAQKLTVLGNLTIVNRRLKSSDVTDHILEKLATLEAKMMEQNPTLFWIKSMSRTSCIFELLDRVIQGINKNILADVDAIIVDDLVLPVSPDMAYNSACILAIASKTIGNIQKQRRMQYRAVEMLRLADNRGFFKTEKNEELLKNDPDLDGVRKVEMFLQFKP